MIKHGCTHRLRDMFCSLLLKTLSDKCPGQHLAPTGNIRSLSKNRLCPAFVGTTTSFGPQRLHTAHWEWLPPTDGIGSVILGGDRGVVFACLVDGTYSVSLLGSMFCLLNFLE